MTGGVAGIPGPDAHGGVVPGAMDARAAWAVAQASGGRKIATHQQAQSGLPAGT